MSGPPKLVREIPGLKPHDRKAEFKKDQQAARQALMQNNRYAILANNGAAGNEDALMEISGEPKVKKPPPIELFGVKISEIKTKIDSCENLTCEVDYRISATKVEKGVRETVKVYPKNNQDYTILKQFFSEQRLEYSSHPLFDDKKVKICMYGLIEMDVEEVKTELKKYFGVVPCDIKMIKPKDDNKTQTRIYILYFKKSDKVKVADLRSAVTGLFSIRVRFEYYSPRKYGPTQCANCQDFGHGTENCHRSPKCVRCGGKHLSKSCIFLPKEAPATPNTKVKIPDNLVKCANCGGSHTANFTGCSYRANVIKKQQHFKKHGKQSTRNFAVVEEDFPVLQTSPGATAAMNDIFTWKNNSHPPSQQSTFDAMQRFLDSQQMMASMMNQMMTQMSTMLKTINDLLEKITTINDGRK